MAAKRIKLELSDEYLRENRDRLQREYDLRQRARLLQDEVSRRWGSDANQGRVAITNTLLEYVDRDWLVFTLESASGLRRMRCTYEIIAGHAIFGTPYEVTRKVSYVPIAPQGRVEFHVVSASDLPDEDTTPPSLSRPTTHNS
jgi:hypothetical protein